MMNYGQENNIQTEYRVFEQEANMSDDRVKEIFDRYHVAKFITIDDLKYLWLKDPDSCKRIIQNIIGEKDTTESVKDNLTVQYLMEINNMIKYKVDQEAEVETGQKYIASECASVSEETIVGLMNSLKIQIESMEEGERQELINSINDTSELEHLISKMKFWDDSFSENMTKYSYQIQNGFNQLA